MATWCFAPVLSLVADLVAREGLGGIKVNPNAALRPLTPSKPLQRLGAAKGLAA
jgi:hypothetical protein